MQQMEHSEGNLQLQVLTLEKDRGSQVNNLTLCLKEFEEKKERKITKPKAIWREIIDERRNKIKKKIDEAKSWFFEKY